MEGHGAGVNTEQCIPAQRFHVSVLDVEGVMKNHRWGVDWRFVIRGICDGEVGETGDVYGWRLSSGSRGDWVHFWSDDRIEWW